MKTLPKLALALAAVLALGVAVADEAKTVTLSGKIACAKCTLKKADAKECQSVLVVTGDNAGEYYLTKNDVTAKSHVCTGEKPATVTGTIEDKDGKKWLVATKIDAAPAEGHEHAHQ